MAAKVTAGILVYRIQNGVLQVLLAHAGGPFWARRNDGAWSIFKGEPDANEAMLAAAKREFEEETGQLFPDGTEILELGTAKLGSGKEAHIWAIEQDYDPVTIQSNTFEMEWPRTPVPCRSFRRTTAPSGSMRLTRKQKCFPASMYSWRG